MCTSEQLVKKMTEIYQYQWFISIHYDFNNDAGIVAADSFDNVTVTHYEKRDHLDKISFSNNGQNVKKKLFFFNFQFFSPLENSDFWLHFDIILLCLCVCKV